MSTSHFWHKPAWRLSSMSGLFSMAMDCCLVLTPWRGFPDRAQYEGSNQLCIFQLWFSTILFRWRNLGISRDIAMDGSVERIHFAAYTIRSGLLACTRTDIWLRLGDYDRFYFDGYSQLDGTRPGTRREIGISVCNVVVWAVCNLVFHFDRCSCRCDN